MQHTHTQIENDALLWHSTHYRKATKYLEATYFVMMNTMSGDTMAKTDEIYPDSFHVLVYLKNENACTLSR